jgi:uncharacterized protein (DUF427 family)
VKAIWNDHVIAEADKQDLIYIEGNWNFPPDSIKFDVLKKSDTPYTCAWKGECQYYDISIAGELNPDAAFCYPTPKPSAIRTVGKDFGGYLAFWRGVEVVE